MLVDCYRTKESARSYVANFQQSVGRQAITDSSGLRHEHDGGKGSPPYGYCYRTKLAETRSLERIPPKPLPLLIG